MSGIEISDFSAYASGTITWYENGVHQPTDGSRVFVKENSDYIHFVTGKYPESIYAEYGYWHNGLKRTITFIAPVITVVGIIENGLELTFVGNTTINCEEIKLQSNEYAQGTYIGTLKVVGNLIISGTITTEDDYGELNVSDGYLNIDNVTWTNSKQNVVFGSNTQLQITSFSNGKTLIKAATVTGTITLDVQSGVNEGDTFSIEATDNQLVITDGEWIATPSTSGNVTTYTLAKATLQKPKFRLLYTVG